VESRNPQGADDLVILLSKVSSQDIASFPQKLKELDGVREVTIMKKSKDRAPS
jgi:putative Mg2+ transporter-C (MgtC) family protein